MLTVYFIPVRLDKPSDDLQAFWILCGFIQ
jgi:hypothetical protein